jgi:hypothetical protein
MGSMRINNSTVEVVITSSEEKSPFEIQLLIENFDPRNHEETRGKYTVFHETILKTIGQPILDYADISPGEKERYSIREVLLGEIDYMDFDDDEK